MPHAVDVTTPSDREFHVTRVFDAPAHLVFEAHTRPELVRRWMLGPPGWSMPVCDIDLRVGGRYRYEWRDDASGSQFGTGGEFREITAPERIVTTEVMDGFEHAGEMIFTQVFTEQDGRTTMVGMMLFPSKEVRDQALQSGMTDGMAAGYDRLEEMLAEAPAVA